ncbi:MAG: prepilin-type N-terminal cleavage/methylation domain-containing protein [Candidatus Marinimicrobia bacterium]|nr:prepilin-type N-terminal cleavage/methylation domain-containing protein [Candidatus Neomarinimicrobiota bacterium]
MKQDNLVKSQKGFSLIEIILVILAIGIIGTMAASMLAHGADIYKETIYRQSFIGQARSAFWRMSRESGLQRSASNFTLSGPKYLYSRNAHNENVEFSLLNVSDLNYTAISGTTYPLSSQLKTSESLFRYYNQSFTEIQLSENQTLGSQAETVQLLQLDMSFKQDDDSVRFSSYIYPNNFRYGKKMSYHD